MNNCQVIVVGAGIAGLAAAKTLLENGVHNIKILEAQGHPGGRIYSVPLNGHWVEAGAQWIHGQNNEVWRLAEKYGLLSEVISAEGEGNYIRDDGVIFDPLLVEEIEKVVTNILQECEQYAYDGCREETIPTSIGDHLRQKFEQYLESCSQDTQEQKHMKEELYDWHLRFQIIDNSCTQLEKLSAKAWGNYSFSGGQDYVNFKEGYSSLVNAVVNDLPSGVLCLNSPVTSVKWQNKINLLYQEEERNDTVLDLACKLDTIHLKNGFNNSGCDDCVDHGENVFTESKVLRTSVESPVVVSCGNGMKYSSEHIIVTSSLGCLKMTYKKMFDPKLPHSMEQAIEDMGFAAINKIFLDFKKPWWTPDIKGFQLIWSKDSCITPSEKEDSSWTRDLTGFDVVLGQEGVLVGWVGGKGAELVEDVTEEDIGRHCTELLRRFTLKEDIPIPQKVIRSQWHKNQYIKGGYSNSTNLCDVSHSGPSNLASPVWAEVYHKNILTNQKYPVLLLAGEAAHEHYFSTTHGAYETGQTQAHVILDYLKSQCINGKTC